MNASVMTYLPTSAVVVMRVASVLMNRRLVHRLSSVKGTPESDLSSPIHYDQLVMDGLEVKTRSQALSLRC